MSLAERYREIRDRMDRAAESVKRDPASVTLVAVSKTFSADLIREVYELGHRDFGESKWQEAQPKVESLPADIRWHFIGHLQSNKAKRVAESFEVIHSLSSESQLKEIVKAKKRVEAFIEVNVGDEAQKSGIPLEDSAKFQSLVLRYEQVNLRGLMAIGPAHLSAEMMRPFFKAVAEMNRRIGGDALSLGMSGDFEVAIQEGSTHIRVGTALFGAR